MTSSSNKETLAVLEDLKTKLFHVRAPEDIAAFKAELDLLINDAKEGKEPSSKEPKEPTTKTSTTHK